MIDMHTKASLHLLLTLILKGLYLHNQTSFFSEKIHCFTIQIFTEAINQMKSRIIFTSVCIQPV